MSENVFECPYCQSENIQSYNIAYASGFSNVSGVTTGVGVGMSGRVGVGVGNTVGTQQTVLSMMAPPPKKKSTTSLFIMGTLGIYFGLGLVLLVSGLSKSNWSLLLYIGAYAILIYAIHRRTVWNRTVYPQLRRDWERTYICLRCGNKFRLDY